MKCITINKFIKILQIEFDFLKKDELLPNSLLYDTFGGSSLNLLFLRGIINEHFGINLTDNEIKECITLNDLYTKIQTRLEN